MSVVFRALAARVGAAQALTSEAYALAFEQSVGLGGLDHEVLTGLLGTASFSLSNLISAMLPDGRDNAASVAAAALRHRPCISPARDPRAYLITLVRVALRHATKARRFVQSFYREEESRVKASIVTAHSNLTIALYLLEDRQSSDETLQTVLSECREIVRRRRDGGSDVAAA